MQGTCITFFLLVVLGLTSLSAMGQYDEFKDKNIEFTLDDGDSEPAFEYEDETSLCSFKYRTYMNNIALLPQFFMKLLQSQNVKRTIAKSASIISGNEPEPPEPHRPPDRVSRRPRLAAIP